jgi:hypothetical protein
MLMAMDPCVLILALAPRRWLVYCPFPIHLDTLLLVFSFPSTSILSPRPPAFLVATSTTSICGRWPSIQTTKRVLVLIQMNHLSLTIPLHQTIPSSLTPTPSPLSSSPTPVTPSSIFLPQHLLMSGVAKNKAGAGAKPPRPPNAWIIYRSDKLQSLPPPPLGQPKPTQAEVSKIISAQWRAESEDVRAIYDQRAETAKADHARMYPDYRFAPMKRADRDRIREEKRQAKEQERAGRKVRSRAAPYPLPNTASSYNTSSSLIIKHVVPNANYASSSMSSSISSSYSSRIPNSLLGVDVAPYYGPTRVSFDASPDLRLQPFDSQNLSFNESLHLGTAVSSESSSSMVPHHFTFSIPQSQLSDDWLPSPSAELSPLPDIPVPELSPPPPSTQDSSQEARAIPTSFVFDMAYVLPRFAHFTFPCLAWIVPTCRTS